MDETPNNNMVTENSAKEAVFMDAEQFLKDAKSRMDERLAMLRGEDANDSPFNTYAQHAFSNSRSMS